MATPSLFKLTASEQRNAIDKLIAGAAPQTEFYLLLILSTVITTIGLLLDSMTVVIGGMLVAPIISPILSIAMAIVMADFKLLWQAVKVLSASIAIVMIIALFISLISVGIEVNSEIAARGVVSFGFFFVALAAGIAAAFAFSRPSLSEAIPGIAVTVALLPPLVVVAIAIPLADYGLFVKSLGLFGLNILGIITAATMVFSLMGFYRQRKQAVERLEQEMKQKEQGA